VGEPFVWVGSNVETSVVESSSLRSKTADLFVRITAGLLFAFTALALTDHLLGASLVARILPGSSPLGPGAAVPFLALSGAAFLVAEESSRRQVAGKALGLVVALLGAATAAEHVFGVDLRIDRLLASGGGPTADVRMSLASAVELVLLGAAAFAIDVKTPQQHRLSDFLVLTSLFVLLQLALASLCGAAGAFEPRTGVGLGSTLFFLLVAAALLSARVESAAVGLLGSDRPAGRVARRLLPLAIGGPLLVGLIAIVGVRSGWLDQAGAISLLVTVAIAGFVDIVWLGSDGMRRAEQALQVASRAHARSMRTNAAREQAERSRAHYLELLRDLDAIVWEADLESGRLKFVSPAVREMLGDSPERLLASGDVWSRLPHPRDRERIAAALRAADEERRDCDFEFRTVTADGRVRWLESRLYAGPANGDRHWQRGVMIDVTERKEHEQRLAAQYETAKILAESQTLHAALPRLLAVFGSTLGWETAAVWMLDRELGVLRCAEAWQASTNGTPAFAAAARDLTFARGEEFPGRVWASGQPLWMADVAREEGLSRAGAAEGEALHAAIGAPIRAREEFIGVVELYSVDALLPDERLLALVASLGNQIGQFIERKRGDERLREEGAALETVTRLSSMSSGTLDVDKLIQELTDAATKLANAQFGTFFYHSRDGQGQGYRSYTSAGTSRDTFGLPALRSTSFPIRLFSSDGPLRIDDLRSGPPPSGVEIPFAGPSVASVLAVPVVSRTGRILGGLWLAHPDPGAFTKREERVVAGIAAHAAVAIDNAELYEAERRAREAAETASRAKDEFLAMLGHELRNPIGAIRNSVEALEISQARSGDGAGEMLCSIIGRQTETLAQLVDDLLDVTRLISGKIRLRTRLVDLLELTNQTLESLRAAGKASRHFVHCGGESVFVDADPVRLEQIITNLIENALKYTPDGGEVEVAVERHGSAGAQLRVRDNGQGIEPDLLPRIFDLFVQGKQSLDRPRGGLGIGLTLVRRLAELHGGSVEVESAGVGQGSEFRVRLPAHPSDDRAAAEPTLELGKVTARHVLIAEDHADSRESLRLLLEASGHRVDAASNGNEAVELALARAPEIAFIDIGLPGLDGYDVAREIRASEGTNFVYLVALTGYGQPIDRRRALESGFNEHMVKPLRRDKLLRLMASIDSPERRPSE
jgi:PAS domain S-box-containing protein